MNTQEEAKMENTIQNLKYIIFCLVIVVLTMVFSNSAKAAPVKDCMAVYGHVLATTVNPMKGFTAAMSAKVACERGEEILMEVVKPVARQRILLPPKPAGQVCQVYNGALICTPY